MNIEKSVLIDQGMNPEKIYRLIKYIKDSHTGINSLVILKNGKAVTEAAFFPYHGDVQHGIEICAMVATATLVGIAVKEGLIKSVNEKVLDLFPDKNPGERDSRKEALTIEHLLQMTTGLEWNDVVFDESNSSNRMWANGDQVGYILERPMVAEAGKNYNHCLGGVHLLSAVLQKVTGMTTAAYAEERLFRPLGIGNTRWYDDNQGITVGYHGLYMKLQDMAKIGQLYLQRGRWNGVQIITEEWAAASVRKQVETPAGPWSYYGSGYMWSMNRFGGYCVKSLSGCSIFVLPRFDMVVAMAGSITPQEIQLPETLIETYVIPAARFSGDKASGSKTQALLEELLEQISKPQEPARIVKLPKLAKLVSGKVYSMQPTIGEKKFKFEFSGGSECCIEVHWHDNVQEFPVGLDGICRVTATEANKGSWQNGNTFVLEKKMLDCNAKFIYTFTFDEDRLTLKEWSSYAGDMAESEGRVESSTGS